MKLLYYCHNCGDFIDELSVNKMDEKKLGFDILTEEEKKDIIKWNKSGDILYVGSVCDNCYHELNNLLGDNLEPNHKTRLYSDYDPPRMH